MRDTLLPRLRLSNLSQRHLPASLLSRLGIHIVDIHEADLRTELVALPGLSANTEELVDLLERETLGLVDHEPDEDDADPAEKDVSNGTNGKRGVQRRPYQNEPQMKNTLLPRLAYSSLTMYGVAYAMAQFRSQLVAVVIERHLARTLSGNISPVTTPVHKC